MYLTMQITVNIEDFFRECIVRNSVAVPGCLSRILIFTHPGSRISDPKTATKEKGEKKYVVIPFLKPQISQNCKLFYFWKSEEKNLGQFSKNYRTFYPEMCHQDLKNMGLGSGIQNPGSEIKDS
jgi:hypothetical protein